MLREVEHTSRPMHKGLRLTFTLVAFAALIVIGNWTLAKYNYKLKLEVGRDCGFYQRGIADGSHERQLEPERLWREQYIRQYCG